MDFSQLTELQTLLVDGGLRDVSTDIAQVKVPGIWIKAPTVSRDTLSGGFKLDVELVLIVSKTSNDRALAALAELLTAVALLIDQSGPCVPGTILMPDASVLPMMRYPVQLYT